MNFYIKMLSYCLVTCLFMSCQDKQHNKAKTIKINDNWKFVQGDIPKAKEISFDDSNWETVSLPHDWSISKPFSKENPSFSRGAWLPAGISYYRRKIDLSRIENNQKIFIHFEGAYRNAEVWINNHYLGKRPSGYAAFEYELTPFISRKNENIITVKLDNSEQPGSRWYSGNGIYRDVYLSTKNDIYIPTWGTYVTIPEVNSSRAIIHVETSLKNTKAADEKVTLKISIIDYEGIEVTTKKIEVTLKQKSDQQEKVELRLNAPKLWDINSPNLYTVKVELLEDTITIDSKIVKTGIRSMVYTVENGFILNGKPLKVKGVCLHHGAGPLGSAARKTSYERQIRILKEMGANAVRTAHNPFDTEFLETCDEMGMLVMNEAFDEWEVAKEPQTFREKGNKIRIPISYYANLFKEYSDKDLTDFVLRDRNHPSIFMWSIGNEIDQMHDESGVAIAKRLSNIIHKYDYRPVTCGVNGYGWGKWPYEPAVAQIDVPGYNYAKAENYDKEHDNFPNRKMIVTEHTSAQMIANRGEYYPFKNKDQALQLDLPIEHPDTKKFVESRNFYTGGIQAWQDVKNRSFVMGAFVWTGWDYLGETIPYAWPASSSSFGVVDLAGFPKDGYYYYQSEWSDKPVIHTFPHWNWEGHEGEKINLNVFSNVKEVELIVNGVSQGKKVNNLNSSEILTWEVLYQPGIVKAIGYDDGKKIVEEEIKTADTIDKLKLEVADSSEITYIEVTALDESGTFVPTADGLINFEVENAKIIGVGNGNNRTLEPFVANYRKLYNGKCVIILQKQDNHSKAVLKATLSEVKITQNITF